jgi:hypothetical protein
MKCEVEIDVEIPEGYKIKRIGAAKKGELYIDIVAGGSITTAGTDHRYVAIVVEKDLKWRRATPAELLDAMMHPMKHKLRYWQGVTPFAPYGIVSLDRDYVTLNEMPDRPIQVPYQNIEILVEE